MRIRNGLFPLRLLLDRFRPRERLLLLGVLVLVLALATQGLLWFTGLTDHSGQRARIEDLRNRFSSNQDALLTLQQARNNPRTEALGEQNARLEEQLSELDSRIERITEVLIPPETMVTLLRELLAGNDLTLVSLNVVPAAPIRNGTGDAGVMLYRHGLELELSGDYDALIGYLDSIESLPWQLFWDELGVETRDYPTLRIRLRVHTLSDQEVWLNV